MLDAERERTRGLGGDRLRFLERLDDSRQRLEMFLQVLEMCVLWGHGQIQTLAEHGVFNHGLPSLLGLGALSLWKKRLIHCVCPVSIGNVILAEPLRVDSGLHGKSSKVFLELLSHEYWVCHARVGPGLNQ